jgi:hypothetical protein
MTNQQLTPTEELLNQWSYAFLGDWREIAVIAARWGYKQGADQELEACCEWLDGWCHDEFPGGIENLRAARRPEPLSLKEQALAVLDDCADCLDGAHENTIRLALEQLP